MRRVPDRPGPIVAAMPAPLRIGLVHNRYSGKGRGPDFVARLRAQAEPIEWLDIMDLPLDLAMAEGALDALDGAIIVGGDGTLHHALTALTEAKGGRGVPTLIAPLGTENVVAKELGLTPRVSRVLASLEAFREGAPTTRSDLGIVHHPDNRPGTLFALMLTTGPDAAVLHRVARARVGTTSKLDYVVPTISRALRPRVGHLSVTVDGQELANERRGCLIVAIGPRYPLRLNLARNASRTDGLLDTVFLPASNTASLLGWASMARLGLHVRHPQARYAQGKRIEFTMHDHDPKAEMMEALQVDGEIERVACDSKGAMVIETMPSALPLIMPVAAEPRAETRPAMAGG